MADSSADIIRGNGTDVAINPKAIDYTTNIDVTESDGTVTVKVKDSPTFSGQVTANTLLHKPVVETVAATNVITASESGSVFFLSSATEFVSTLPAPAAGLKFTFVIAAAPSGASYTVVTASSANIILGNVLTSQDAGGSADTEQSGGDTITFVDGKAVVGDRVDVVSDGTKWYATGVSKVFDAITITTAS